MDVWEWIYNRKENPVELAAEHIGGGDLSVNIYDAWHQFHNFEDEKIFIDVTHNAEGKMCRVYFNNRTKKYEFIPVGRESR